MKKMYYFFAILTVLLIASILFYFIILHFKPILIYQCQEINKPGHYALARDLSPAAQCLVINADNVLVDGRGHSITGGYNTSSYGIYANNTNNLTIKNFVISNYVQGIFILHSENATVINNHIFGTLQAIFLLHTQNSKILDNDIERSPNIGIVLIYSDSNNVENNKVRYSLYPMAADSSSDNLIMSNIFDDNIKLAVKLSRNNSIVNQNEEVNFKLNLGSTINCSKCSYNAVLTPKEDNFLFTRQGDQIYGSFTPTRKGIYSLYLSFTDLHNNTEDSKYIYLVSPEKTSVEDYYVRGVNPTHGQAQSWGTYQEDYGSLLSQKPLIDETRICTDWVQFSFDSLPEYLLGVVKEINFSMTYKQNASMIYIGPERFATYDPTDFNYNISQNGSTDGNFIKENFSFNINWTMNYFWEWYWQSIKLSTTNGNPQIKIEPENPDILKVKYIYSSTPAIRFISNEKVLILAATMNDSDEASIILGSLEDCKNTKFSIEMPDKNKNYKANYNGNECNDDNCRISGQSNGIINFTLNIRNNNNNNSLEVLPLN